MSNGIWRGKQDVDKQNRITPFNDFYFTQINGVSTTLTADAVVDNRLINVASVVNISIGDWVGIFGEDGRYYFSEVLGIDTLELEMQTLLDFPYESGATVISTTRDMNVNGAVTPQIFEIQTDPLLGLVKFDITRILLQCYTDDIVDLSKFGDIVNGLTRGIYIRSKDDSTYRNKIIIQDNGDFGLFAYDWAAYVKTRPNEGQDGFLWRFSLNGDDKHGVTNRITDGINNLQWVVQDDLTSLALFRSTGANHEVDW